MTVKEMFANFLENKLFVYSGLRQKEKMTKGEKTEWLIVMEKIFRSKSWLSVDLMQLILIKGASGDYGEFTGLNAVTVKAWINQYYRDNQNEIDIKIRKETHEEKKNQDEKIEYYLKCGTERIIKIYNQCRAEFKNSGKDEISYHSIPKDLDFGSVWFNIFQKAGLMDFPEELNKELYQKVERHMKLENQSGFNFVISEKSVSAGVRGILLRMSFAKWIMQDLELEDIMKDYKVFEIARQKFFDV